MTSLPQKIDEVLEYYDYCLVGVKGENTDNKVFSNYPTTIRQVYNYLTIHFGADRVSKEKSKVKVIL